MHTNLTPEARAALQQLLFADDRPRATLGEVVIRYRAEHLSVDSLSPKTIERVDLSLRRLAPYYDRDIASPWRQPLSELYAQYGEIPGSVIGSTLLRLLGLAAKWGHRDAQHDIAGLCRIRTRPRTAIVAPEHRPKLIAALGDEVLPWRIEAAACAALIVRTGMRVSEARTLECAHVSIADRLAFLPRTKNGKPRMVPLVDEALELVVPRLIPGRRYVYRRCRVDEPIGTRTIGEVLADAAKRAGIPHVHPHKLRHTFATEAKMLGIDDRTTADVLGNTPEELRRTYQHVPTPDAMDAMRAVASAYAKAGGR
jgi:integrase